jgi:hypothetical protein
MIDRQVAELARRGLGPRLEKQMEELRQALGTIVAQVGANRIAPGSPGAIHTTRPCVAVVAPVVDLAWKNLWRVVTTLRKPASAQDLKLELQGELADFFSRVRGVLREKVKFTGGNSGSETARAMSAFDIEVRRVMELAEVEIDLFVHEPRDPSEITPPAAAAGATFHIYSPVGAIQTGPGASAIVVQHLDESNREALRAALRELRDALHSVTEPAMVDRSEVAEMTRVTEAELDKSKPNAAILTSLLSGIATGVQTVAAAQPAYMALKAAAAAVGVPLP